MQGISYSHEIAGRTGFYTDLGDIESILNICVRMAKEVSRQEAESANHPILIGNSKVQKRKRS